MERSKHVRLPFGVRVYWDGRIPKSHDGDTVGELESVRKPRIAHIIGINLRDTPYRYEIVFRDDYGKESGMWVTQESLFAPGDPEENARTFISKSLCF